MLRTLAWESALLTTRSLALLVGLLMLLVLAWRLLLTMASALRRRASCTLARARVLPCDS